MTDWPEVPEPEREPAAGRQPEADPVDATPADEAGVATGPTTGEAPSTGEGSTTEDPTEGEAERDADPLQAAKEEVAELQTQLAERTADLQRLQAEYVNYKRRVERDRELVQQNATYRALAPIIEVLDTIDRAREHGPLEDGMKAVAEQLERAVTAAGLTRYGAVGDEFDPTLHEALSHIGEDPEVSVTTCKVIAKAGYRIGDRVVRAAQVLVVDPPSSVQDAAAAGPEGEAVTASGGASAGSTAADDPSTADGLTTGVDGETRDEEVHQEE